MEKNASYTFEHKQKSFTNGAHIIPIEITKKNGTKVFMWVVDSFEDDTYQNGKMIYPKSCAENIDDLVNGEEEEEEDDGTIFW